MTKLVWDKVGDRVYQSGLDRGVLYLPDGSAVPWNGLTSVVEKFNRETSPIYYDGVKIGETTTLGEFQASMNAVTYPEEFIELEGMGNSRPGVYYGDQRPKAFALCFRTQIANALEGDTVGYKLHIIYNVTASPSDKTYATMSTDPSLSLFEWIITAVPEEVSGFRPTAHIVLDSREMDPWLLEDIEKKLYGSSSATASLIPMADLVIFMAEWARIKIIDHGDGTWSAVTDRPGFISLTSEGLFTIVKVNAIYLDEDTYIISDTADISDLPTIKIIDNGNGTWTASTDHGSLILVAEDGTFEIRDATATFLDPDTYIISDTVET